MPICAGFTLQTRVANVTLSQLTRLSTEGPRLYLTAQSRCTAGARQGDKELQC
jgi:hypothetical protein